MFITYGDTFLPNPNSYDELYYEIIRMHQVFDNLYSMGKHNRNYFVQLKTNALMNFTINDFIIYLLDCEYLFSNILITSLLDFLWRHSYWMSCGYILTGCLVVTSLMDVLWLHSYWMSCGDIPIGCCMVTSLSDII